MVMSVVETVVECVVALPVVVRGLTLLGIVVRVQDRPFGIFKIGRFIRPIDVSLILTAPCIKVVNRQRG